MEEEAAKELGEAEQTREGDTQREVEVNVVLKEERRWNALSHTPSLPRSIEAETRVSRRERE